MFNNVTEEEKKRIIDALDRLSRTELERILMAVGSFSKWLASTFADIFRKIGSMINDMWEWIKSCFS